MAACARATLGVRVASEARGGARGARRRVARAAGTGFPAGGGDASDDDLLPVVKIPKAQRAEDVGVTTEYKALGGETIGERLSEVRGKYLDDQRKLHQLYLDEEQKISEHLTSDKWDGAEWRGPRRVAWACPRRLAALRAWPTPS